MRITNMAKIKKAEELFVVNSRESYGSYSNPDLLYIISSCDETIYILEDDNCNVYFCHEYEALLDFIVSQISKLYDKIQEEPIVYEKIGDKYSITLFKHSNEISIETSSLQMLERFIYKLELATNDKYKIKPKFPTGSKIKNQVGNYEVKDSNLIKSSIDNMFEYEYKVIDTTTNREFEIIESELIKLL